MKVTLYPEVMQRRLFLSICGLSAFPHFGYVMPEMFKKKEADHFKQIEIRNARDSVTRIV